MVDVAQSVRASDCGSEGRGFETHLPPQKPRTGAFFIATRINVLIGTKVEKYPE